MSKERIEFQRYLVPLDDLAGGLYLVEVERDVPWYGAVEPGLDEGGPAVGEGAGAAGVGLAHACDAGEDGLESGCMSQLLFFLYIR